MSKDSLIRAEHINWNVQLDPNYDNIEREFDQFNLNIMKNRNESHCSTANTCDKEYATHFKIGKILDAFIHMYLKSTDTPQRIAEKKTAHRFKISVGVKFTNPNYPANQNEELIGTDHWVVGPCPPFCDLGTMTD